MRGHDRFAMFTERYLIGDLARGMNEVNTTQPVA